MPLAPGWHVPEDRSWAVLLAPGTVLGPGRHSVKIDGAWGTTGAFPVGAPRTGCSTQPFGWSGPSFHTPSQRWPHRLPWEGHALPPPPKVDLGGADRMNCCCWGRCQGGGPGLKPPGAVLILPLRAGRMLACPGPHKWKVIAPGNDGRESNPDPPSDTLQDSVSRTVSARRS